MSKWSFQIYYTNIDGNPRDEILPDVKRQIGGKNMQFGFKKLQFPKNDLPNHEQKL